MLDACTVERITGRTYNPATRKHADTKQSVYVGKCKVQSFEAYEQTAVAGGHTYTLIRYHLHVPISAPDFAADDVVTITASRLDPALVGRVFRIAGPSVKSLATARRFPIEEVTA